LPEPQSSQNSRLSEIWSFLDLIALAVALPIFVVAGLPLAGYFVAALAWLVQRALQLVLQRRAEASDDPRVIVGVTAGGMIARAWIVAGAVFGVGLAAGDEDGLAAAALVIALFTIYFTVQLVTRPFEVGR
jgi:hypothetical protein